MAGATDRALEIKVDTRSLDVLGKALRSEADGRRLRVELRAELADVARPMVADAKAAIMATPSKGSSTGTSLRSGVARAVKPVIRTTGKDVAVSVHVGKTPGTRGFTNAGARFNRPNFRRRVYGGPWVTQVGNPRWFDDAVRPHTKTFNADVQRVVERMTRRIAVRAKAGNK